MIVRCINNSNFEKILELGKEYKVSELDNPKDDLIDLEGHDYMYDRNRFEEVK